MGVSSVAGKEGNPNVAAYSAAKAGIPGLAKSLGKELAKFDIAVNAITPGTARTPMLDGLMPEFIGYMKVRIPCDRFVEVDESVAMVTWMLSGENSFTNAAVFDLSGGRQPIKGGVAVAGVLHRMWINRTDFGLDSKPAAAPI